ncbi:MerR family transcriptional regulator [Salinibius halmophilus]|uniref:MerR family transcriptional regulator n=1 Tax=Salinibius halmophilus TaxID=1853216 RepID=UPI000E6631B4|nr:MerR family transcriptional regulator [Salinibius halmophilus]
MKIGELAQRTGVSASTIRYYEDQGILPKPKRQASGYRVYDDTSMQKLMLIRYSLQLGFSLQELQQLLTDEYDQQALMQSIDAKMAEMERNIAKLRAQKAELKKLQQTLSQAWQAGQCPNIDLG